MCLGKISVGLPCIVAQDYNKLLCKFCRYTNEKSDMMTNTNVITLDVPELLRPADEASMRENAMEAVSCT